MVEGKYGLAGRLVAVGLALGVAGCESMTDSDIAALGVAGYGVNAKTPEQAQSAAILSEFARTSGRRQHDMKVAREGRVVLQRKEPEGGRNSILNLCWIKNLDTREIKYFDEVNSGANYVYDCLIAKENFPRKGFQIIWPVEDGRRKYHIATSGDCESILYIKERGTIPID